MDLLTVVGHKMYAPKGIAALRLSVGRWSTADEIDRAADHIAAAAQQLRL
ncbi:hypothetical protein [Actinophytocola sp.]